MSNPTGKNQYTGGSSKGLKEGTPARAAADAAEKAGWIRKGSNLVSPHNKDLKMYAPRTAPRPPKPLGQKTLKSIFNNKFN